jgi:DDE superfamily endonuclease
MTTPSKTNDLKAYRFSKLSEMIESLPYGYFVGGDNAYVNSEHLIVPFSGRNITPEQDTFNYYLSQLCVRIENTFALFVNRWGILWKPLEGKLISHNRTILCLVKLHNFAIIIKLKFQKMMTIIVTNINIYSLRWRMISVWKFWKTLNIGEHNIIYLIVLVDHLHKIC